MSDNNDYEKQIADLKREIAELKDKNHALVDMVITNMEEEFSKISADEFEEMSRNPVKPTLDEIIKEFELKLKA